MAPCYNVVTVSICVARMCASVSKYIQPLMRTSGIYRLTSGMSARLILTSATGALRSVADPNVWHSEHGTEQSASNAEGLAPCLEINPQRGTRWLRACMPAGNLD